MVQSGEKQSEIPIPTKDSEINADKVSSERLGATSFLRRKSSEIRKIMPKHPEKAVKVLRHIFEQYRKSPRKNKYLLKLWPEEDRKLGRYMYLLVKYRSQKNISQLQRIVSKIKWQYKSLRGACRHTDMRWSQFHKYTSQRKQTLHQQHKTKSFNRKLNSDQVDSIRKFFNSEEATFPLPDRKYAGKRL